MHHMCIFIAKRGTAICIGYTIYSLSDERHECRSSGFRGPGFEGWGSSRGEGGWPARLKVRILVSTYIRILELLKKGKSERRVVPSRVLEGVGPCEHRLPIVDISSHR